MNEPRLEPISDGPAGSTWAVYGSPEGRRVAGRETNDLALPADALASVRHQLAQWRDVSEALHRELEREELDPAAIERLLERREAVHRHLTETVRRMGAGACTVLQEDAGLRRMATELVACDRLVIERARARQQGVCRQLDELRRLRQGAAGYRRAAGRGQVVEPSFFDRCI